MEKQLLNVGGMSCEHCVKAVKDELLELAGVDKVSVSLENNTVEVEFDSSKIDISKIKSTIDEIGYDVK